VKYIAITGPVGSGKTSTVNGIKAINPDLVAIYESFCSKHFLNDFASNKSIFSLETTLHFLLMHSAQLLRTLINSDHNTVVITDFYIAHDIYFAKSDLRGEADL